jgi:hypothetical protein
MLLLSCATVHGAERAPLYGEDDSAVLGPLRHCKGRPRWWNTGLGGGLVFKSYEEPHQ